MPSLNARAWGTLLPPPHPVPFPLSSSHRVLSTPESSQFLPERSGSIILYSFLLLALPPITDPSSAPSSCLCCPSPTIAPHKIAFDSAFPFLQFPRPPTHVFWCPNSSQEPSLLGVKNAKRGFCGPHPFPFQSPLPVLHPRSPIPPL